jgi:hypothetical protein
MTRTGVDVKIGVHIATGRKLVVTVITRVHPEVYGPQAYIRWIDSDSFNENVTLPSNNPNAEYQGQRTIGGQDAPCLLPVCEQVWEIIQTDVLPEGQNFGGRYEVNFEVARTPGGAEDHFTVAITIDETYKPEEEFKIENITLDSTVDIYEDDQFSDVKTGTINRETLYVTHGINLADEDVDIWDLRLEDVQLCSVPNDTPLESGCSGETLADHQFFQNGGQQSAPGFSLQEYDPTQVPNHPASSVTGFSFTTEPLYTDRVDTQRQFHLVIHPKPR